MNVLFWGGDLIKLPLAGRLQDPQHVVENNTPKHREAKACKILTNVHMKRQDSAPTRMSDARTTTKSKPIPTSLFLGNQPIVGQSPNKCYERHPPCKAKG